MSISIKIPKNIFSGIGSIAELENIINKENAQSIQIFTDSGIRNAGLLDLVTNIIDKTQAEYVVVDNIKPEPSYVDIQEIFDENHGEQPDLIIGFGGGSVMDSAKLCSLLYEADYTIKDLLKNPEIAHKQVTTIMIPTTCGTGSEATVNAIVAIPEKETKLGIVSAEMLPDYVILDAETLRNLPKNIIASTGVDALAHNVECFTSNKATILSNLYALEGARLIFNNIREVYLNPENMKAKEAMLLGSFYGGIAITGSGTTAVHALSYPLGGKFHIAHGISNAILFESVMNLNKENIAEDLAEICDVLDITRIDDSIERKAQYVIDEISDIVKVTEIPTNLNEFGVSKKDLDFLVKAGSEQTRLLVNNKKELSLDDIKSVYLEVIE